MNGLSFVNGRYKNVKSTMNKGGGSVNCMSLKNSPRNSVTNQRKKRDSLKNSNCSFTIDYNPDNGDIDLILKQSRSPNFKDKNRDIKSSNKKVRVDKSCNSLISNKNSESTEKFATYRNVMMPSLLSKELISKDKKG